MAAEVYIIVPLQEGHS